MTDKYFKEGYRAYLFDKHINPYHPENQECIHMEWRKGYNAAKAEYAEPEYIYNFKEAI